MTSLSPPFILAGEHRSVLAGAPSTGPTRTADDVKMQALPVSFKLSIGNENAQGEKPTAPPRAVRKSKPSQVEGLTNTPDMPCHTGYFGCRPIPCGGKICAVHTEEREREYVKVDVMRGAVMSGDCLRMGGAVC